MSIVAVYQDEPPFPATDQHPQAVRYQVSGYWVDATSGQPTAQQVADYIAPPVPPYVSPFQARRALDNAGLRDAVEAAVAAATRDVQDAWQYAVRIERSSPFIAAMQGGLGLTNEQVDQLFIAAAQIT